MDNLERSGAVRVEAYFEELKHLPLPILLRTLRQDAGLSRVELAANVGWKSTGMVNRSESDHMMTPGRITIEKYIKGLGLTFDDQRAQLVFSKHAEIYPY